jgi:hypothetical protein
MATIKQIEANRRNAQLSTGPRTEAGKSAARANALKSGIYARSLLIFDERLSDLEALIQEYFDRFQPASAEERALVDTLVNSEWNLRRLRRVEPELWETHYNNYEKHTATFKDTNTPLAFIYMGIAKELDRLQARINSFDRAWHRALVDLENLQKQRRAAAQSPTPNPQPQTPAPQAADSRPRTSAIGFVPQKRRSGPEPRAAAPLTPDPRPLTPKLGHLPHPSPLNNPSDVENSPTSPTHSII